MQNQPTIEEILKYEEDLIKAVKHQITVEENPETKAVLLKLEVLLKGRKVNAFVQLLSNHKVSISLSKRIQEIDDAMDELRVMNLNLPYPEQRFLIDQGKSERARKVTLGLLLLMIFGFEIVD